MLSYPLRLYRGDTYRWTLTLWADNPPNDEPPTIPIDLTGVAVAAEIRPVSGGTPITVLACAVTLPNTIAMTLTAAACATVPSSGVWDLQLTYASSDVQTVVSGPVQVTGDVTGSRPLSLSLVGVA